jgi:hypothetical protein
LDCWNGGAVECWSASQTFSIAKDLQETVLMTASQSVVPLLRFLGVWNCVRL